MNAIEYNPGAPLRPVLRSKENEETKVAQLDLPGLCPMPTLAERAFLVLAGEWLSDVQNTPIDSPLRRSTDLIALSCLLLTVEWGRTFTSVVRQQMEANEQCATRRGQRAWMDRLSWNLCLSTFDAAPACERSAVQELTVNLDHHNSSVRQWMMELAWFATPWLNPDEVSLRLLKNVADTLAGVSMAAGLAGRFFETPEGFLESARTFTPPDGFEDQYQDRLKQIQERGILAMQDTFWKTEALCRKEIESAVMELPGEESTSETRQGG